MDFTLHQLKVFHVIVEKKSITKASVALNMTQPAVSIQLKNLQNQFDSPLTEVIGRKIYITDFGMELFALAQTILREVENIRYKSQNFRGLIAGKLKISVVSTGKYIMPFFLRDFILAHPHIDLELDVTNRTKVLESLEKNEVDFALVSILPNNLQVATEILMPNKLFLVGSKDFEIPYSDSMDPNLWYLLPLIFRETGSGTRIKMMEYFKEKLIIPKVKLELTSNEAIKQAVMAGLGVSILSLLSIKSELKTGEIKIIPFPELPIHSNWMLIWSPKKQFSLVAQAYLNFIKSNKNQIFEKHFSWIKDYE